MEDNPFWREGGAGNELVSGDYWLGGMGKLYRGSPEGTSQRGNGIRFNGNLDFQHRKHTVYPF